MDVLGFDERGIHFALRQRSKWIPAFAGMTARKASICRRSALLWNRLEKSQAHGRHVNDPHRAFSSAQAVARYAEDPPRKVPGFADLQRMAALLLAELAPEHARILVLGAGGGLELKAFASAYPQW